MSKPFVIFSLSLAGKLRDRGFKIIKVGKNANKPWFNTYLFEDTEAFRQALTELTSNQISKGANNNAENKSESEGRNNRP